MEPPRRREDEDEPYWAHLEKVERWARRLGGPSLEAEDVVQDVMLVACRRWREFRHESELTTWLFAITRKVVSKALRRQKLRRLWRVFVDTDPEEIATGEPGPAADLEQRQAVAQLYVALGKLPERYRVPLVLFELEDMSGEQIATLLELSPANVRVRLHRGRALLVKHLRALGDKA